MLKLKGINKIRIKKYIEESGEELDISYNLKNALKGVNEIRIKMYVEELGEELAIYINLKNIDFSWESLKFPKNDVLFASVIGKKGKLEIVTQGSVRITDLKDGQVYTKNTRFPEKLITAIESGDIYSGERFSVDNNNWFEAIFSERPMDDFSSGDIFESTPESIDDLIDDLVKYYNIFTK